MRPVNAIRTLESRHAHRGLRFQRDHDGHPQGFGSVPAQAFGELDGQRFYFRFRHDHARLNVGPYDAALELALERRRLQWRAVHRDDMPETHRVQDDGGASFEWLMVTDRDLERAIDMDDFSFAPTRVTAVADVHDVTGEEYGSTCSDDEFLTLFQQLIDDLTPVPEADQVDAHTITYLAEGGFWPLPNREDTIVSTPDL